MRQSESAEPPGKIVFISYRRTDSRAESELLCDLLILHLGDVVFLDRSGVRPGRAWRQEIDKNLSSAEVFIPVVGPTWLSASAGGQRRIERSDDTLRKEIEKALERGIDVIPMRLRGVRQPGREELPASIRGLDAVTWYDFDPEDKELPVEVARHLEARVSEVEARPDYSAQMREFQTQRLREEQRERWHASPRPWHAPRALLVAILVTLGGAAALVGAEMVLRLAWAIADSSLPQMPTSTPMLAVHGALIGASMLAISLENYYSTADPEVIWTEWVELEMFVFVVGVFSGTRLGAHVVGRFVSWDAGLLTALVWRLWVITFVAAAIYGLALAGRTIIGRRPDDPAVQSGSLMAASAATSVAAAAIGVGGVFTAESTYLAATQVAGLEPHRAGHLLTWIILGGLGAAALGAWWVYEHIPADFLENYQIDVDRQPESVLAGVFLAVSICAATWLLSRSLGHLAAAHTNLPATIVFHVSLWTILALALTVTSFLLDEGEMFDGS